MEIWWNNFISSCCYICATYTAIQIEGEMRRNGETLCSPPLSQSLIMLQLLPPPCPSPDSLLFSVSLFLCLYPSFVLLQSFSLAETYTGYTLPTCLYVCDSPCELHVSVCADMWLRSWRQGLVKCSRLGYQILLLMHIYHIFNISPESFH